MFTVLATSSFCAAEMTFASGTPGRHNLVQLKIDLRGNGFALTERGVRYF